MDGASTAEPSRTSGASRERNSATSSSSIAAGDSGDVDSDSDASTFGSTDGRSEGPSVIEEAEGLLQSGDAAGAFKLLSGYLGEVDRAADTADALSVRASAALALGDAAQAFKVRPHVAPAERHIQRPSLVWILADLIPAQLVGVSPTLGRLARLGPAAPVSAAVPVRSSSGSPPWETSRGVPAPQPPAEA